MDPRIKLSAAQMRELLKRNLDRAPGPEVSNSGMPGMPPMMQPPMPGQVPGPMMPPPMMPPQPQPQMGPPQGMPIGGPPAMEEAPQGGGGEMMSAIEQAEQLYATLMRDGGLGKYWQSLFRNNPQAQNFKDPELYFISMFVQKLKDPAGFAKMFPEEDKVISAVTGSGQASLLPEGFDPVAQYEAMKGQQRGTPGTVKW